MYILCSDIQIGNKRTTAVNDITVKRSIYNLGSTATIRVPVNAVLHRKDQPTAKVITAQQISVGDKVEIRTGYNGRLTLEFRGYVKAVNLSTPVEIICEDEFWTTRQRNITNGGTITLTKLLEKCGLQIAFAETLTLRNFAVPNKSVANVLAKIRKDYGLSVFFDLEGKVYACRPERVIGDRVKYVLRKNVINDDKLQYRDKSDAKIRINAICFKKDGTKIEAKKGAEGGVEKTLYFYDIENLQELSILAERELQRSATNGYEGSLETFLEPYAAPGMIADVTDPIYADRSSEYYIEAMELHYGMRGGRRIVEIGGIVNGQQ